jgi:hypothetical protein
LEIELLAYGYMPIRSEGGNLYLGEQNQHSGDKWHHFFSLGTGVGVFVDGVEVDPEGEYYGYHWDRYGILRQTSTGKEAFGEWQNESFLVDEAWYCKSYSNSFPLVWGERVKIKYDIEGPIWPRFW